MLVIIVFVIYFIALSSASFAQSANINNDIEHKKVLFGNDKIMMTLDYNLKANISSMILNGQNIIEGKAGIYSIIKTRDANYSTLQLLSEPSIKISNDTISISAIKYGDKNLSINEKDA